MKRILTVMSMALAAALLAGCATTERSAEGAGDQRVRPSYDSVKMGIVNADARRKGVRIIWVNPPENGGEGEKAENTENVENGDPS